MKFNKYASSYDDYAVIQKQMAENLLSKIKNQPKYILDIGCGTGILTSLLSLKFPDANITAIDSSENMIGIAKQKLDNSKIKFIHGDIETNILENQKFDLIISNAVIQWLQSPLITFTNLYNLLGSNGQFCASTFGPETFSELKQTFRKVEHNLQIGPKKHHLTLKRSTQWIELLDDNNFQNIEITESNNKLKYNNCKDLLTSIKQVGASFSQNDHPLGLMRNILSKVMQEYDLTYKEKDHIYATYHLIFLSALK